MTLCSILLVAASVCLKLASAKDVYYNWSVDWVNAAPDGFERPVIGINGQWPCPTIDIETGDRLIVDVYNNLGNESTGIHWHGMFQHSTGFMDGTTGVTQCPIKPGDKLRYDFTVYFSKLRMFTNFNADNAKVPDQSGTYWYHSHNLGQYPDGLWGPFIIRNQNDPYTDQYEDEIILTLTDWYHEQMPTMLANYISTANEADNDGREPKPDRALINANVNATISVKPSTTYLVRVICVGNWPGHGLMLPNQSYDVVEADGTWLQRYPVPSNLNTRLTPGQRLSFLMTTKDDASTNQPIFDIMDLNMMFIDEGELPSPTYNPNATAHFVFNESAPLPPAPIIYALGDADFVDDVNFVPYDMELPMGPVNHQILMNIDARNESGLERFIINGNTYLPQKTPSLYTAMTVDPEASMDASIYGPVNPFVLNYGDVVEIVMNDYHSNLHPFHLHGHNFQVLERTAPNGGFWNGTNGTYSRPPVKRDTIMVQNGGHMIIRFRADNPGVWLFHCHVEWHVETGLLATIIEAPDHFPRTSVPRDAQEVCENYPLSFSGNAAGNRNPYNLTGILNGLPLNDSG